MKLGARELRDLPEEGTSAKIKRRPIYLILEDVYDTYNVGGLFRLADALAFEKIYLCGTTETPPNHKIKKASIGTYKIVPWEYCKNAKEAFSKLSIINGQLSINIVAIEQNEKSIPYTKAEYKLPLALVVGNETSGISKETLKLCDHVVEIPMHGINKSLNVIVSAAIVGYHILAIS